MDSRTWTYGNLALAEPLECDREAASKASLEVIDGGAMKDLPAGAANPRPQIYVLLRWVAAALIASAVLLAIFLRFSSDYSHHAQLVDSLSFEQITVQPGDSLWSLAREHAVKGISTDDLVGIMKARNGISDSLLQPGQSILVAGSVQLE